MRALSHSRISRIGSRSGQRAFTLVELLVVIAVITVLVAILMPVTMQARNRARDVACISNLRQVGTAVLNYSQDWTDNLPRLSGNPFAGSAPDDNWPGGSSATRFRALLGKRISDGDVLRCGNDLGAPEYGYLASAGTVFSQAGSSYIPWSAARPGRYGLTINGARVSGMSPASGHILVRDYGSEWHGYRNRNGMTLESVNVSNGVFADGHAASMKIYSIIVSDRCYVCSAAAAMSSDGTVIVGGGSGDVKAELTGRHSLVDIGHGAMRLQISVSGTVTAADTVCNVDRVFVFAPETRLEGAFRQIAYWVDSLAAA